MSSESLIITVIGIRSSKIELPRTNILILLNYLSLQKKLLISVEKAR